MKVIKIVLGVIVLLVTLNGLKQLPKYEGAALAGAVAAASLMATVGFLLIRSGTKKGTAK